MSLETLCCFDCKKPFRFPRSVLSSAILENALGNKVLGGQMRQAVQSEGPVKGATTGLSTRACAAQEPVRPTSERGLLVLV